MKVVSHFSYKEAVRSALFTIFDNFSTFFYLGLMWWAVYTLVALCFIGLFLSNSLDGSSYMYSLTLGFYAVSYLVEPYIHYQLMCLGLAAQKRESISLKKAFSLSLKNFFHFYAARLLLGIEVFLGTLLLIIPGAYIGAKHYFAGFSLLDSRAKKISEDSRISGILTDGVKLRILLVLYTQMVIQVISFLIALLSVLMPPLFLLSVTLHALVVLVDIEIFKQLQNLRLIKVA